MRTWIESKAVAALRFRAAVALLSAALLCAAAGAAFRDDLIERFGEPSDVDLAALARASAPDSLPRRHVRVRVPGLRQIGVDGDPGKGGAYLYVADVDDRLFLVRARKAPGAVVTGWAEPTATLPFPLEWKLLMDPFCAVYVDTHREPLGMWLALALTGCAAAVGVGIAAANVARSLRPSRIPSVRRAAQWGVLRDVSGAVESAARVPAVRFGAWIVSDDFLVLDRTSSFDVFRWDDLVRASPVVAARFEFKSHHALPGAPIGARRFVRLEFRDGVADVGAGRDDMADVLSFVARRVPHAIAGARAPDR